MGVMPASSAAISASRPYVSSCAAGVHHTEAAPARMVISSAKVMTGAITFRLGTPAARMAVISPSLDMRPRPMRMPTSTAAEIMASARWCQASTRSDVLCKELLTLKGHQGPVRSAVGKVRSPVQHQGGLMPFSLQITKRCFPSGRKAR